MKVLAFLVVIAVTNAAGPRAATDTPNIVMLFVDDLVRIDFRRFRL
jgi:hypothetical protein